MKKPTLKTTYFSPIAALLLIAFSLTGCGPSQPATAPAPEARIVEAVQLTQGPSKPTIVSTAVSALRDEIRQSFKVGGVIENITVREGQSVRKNQLIAALNKTDVQAQLSQAQASYAKALRDFERGKNLQAQEVIARVQLEDLQTRLDLASAQLEQARYAVETSEIRAESDGVVLRRLSQVGEVVAPGQPVILIGSESSGYVMRASLADRDAVRAGLGDPATVSFDAHPGIRWPGKIIELAKAADPMTGTYGVVVQLDTQAHPDLTLLSGLTGRIELTPTDSSGVRQYLPASAVVEGDSRQALIYTVQPDSTVKRQLVQIEFVTPQGLALSKEALPPDTWVVTTGASYLRDGEQVQTREVQP